jgi:hypothetical protein
MILACLFYDPKDHTTKGFCVVYYISATDILGSALLQIMRPS